MSTRSTTWFLRSREPVPDAPTAIIYRHTDGYPEGAGRDLLEFLNEEQTDRPVTGSRIGDPTYLGARYVVFLASLFAVTYVFDRDPKRPFGQPAETKPNQNPRDFLSVGVYDRDPTDIEYRYLVDATGRAWVQKRVGPWERMDFTAPRLVSEVLDESPGFRWATPKTDA